MNQSQETPLSAFFQWEKNTPQQIFLRQPVAGIWKSWTYYDAGLEILEVAPAGTAGIADRGDAIPEREPVGIDAVVAGVGPPLAGALGLGAIDPVGDGPHARSLSTFMVAGGPEACCSTTWISAWPS